MRFTCLKISAWIAASTGSLPRLKTRAGFRVNAQGKLNKTDWYVTRKAEKNIDIPESITTERDQIKATVDIEETEINALTTKKSIILYNSSVWV